VAERDIAMVVEESVSHQDVMGTIQGSDIGILRGAVLFDIYRPAKSTAGLGVGGAIAPNEKSLAIRLTLGRDTSTLTDEEIDSAIQSVVLSLGVRHGARLR
jgi:phenylalanyl-tRNA synthetase beta chain